MLTLKVRNFLRGVSLRLHQLLAVFVNIRLKTAVLDLHGPALLLKCLVVLGLLVELLVNFSSSVFSHNWRLDLRLECTLGSVILLFQFLHF